MKFSVRQILASAAGAVIAAVIASTFGVKGTIIGVAIGSAAATLGTALVAQSIERGHEAVRQVVERVPDSSASTLLRRLGSTDVAGAATSRVDQVAPTEVGGGVEPVGPVARTGAEAGVGAGGRDETVQMEATATPAPRTQRLEASAIAGAPATERLVATASAAPPARALRWSWRTIAAMAGIVFVLALLFITAIELISGKPMSDIFGVGNGTSVGGLFNQSPGPAASTTTTTTPTTTTRPTSSTTSSTTAPTSTTTTAPTGASSTTTSAPPTSGTSTTVGGTGANSGAASTTTSTSVPG